MNSLYFYETRIGKAAIADNGKAIVLLKFVREDGDAGGGTCWNGTGRAGGYAAENAEALLRRAVRSLPAGFRETAFAIAETPLIKEAAKQLYEYLEGKRKAFDIPIRLEGTPFQKAVWQALLRIPYGETMTYGEIADRIGNPKAARAVGMANNRNPVAVFVPCHRVIGADGGLVGYASGLVIKRWLLDLEKMNISKQAQGK